MNAPLLSGAESIKFGVIGGTINSSEVFRLKKLLFRVTRGKALSYFFDLEIDREEAPELQLRHKDRQTFLVLFQEGDYIRNKIGGAIKSFMTYSFDLPDSGHELLMEQTLKTINETEESMKMTLSTI